VISTTTARRFRRRPAIFGLILAMMAAALVMIGAKPALASDTILCHGSGTTDANCTTSPYTDHGYAGNQTSMYWSEYSGINCTNYVAYVEDTVNGATTPSPTNLGNADQWAANASTDGYAVNSTPYAGSVAEWGAGDGYAGSDGHVAYVESVAVNTNGSLASITVSEDDTTVAGSSSQFDWRVIAAGSADWPTNFIHFKDLTPPPPASSPSLLGVQYGNNIVGKSSLGDAWSSDLNPGNVGSTSADAVRISGSRITWIGSNGELYAKDWDSTHGFGNSWVDEYGAVTSYAASSQLLVILSGGNLYGKAGLSDSWSAALNPSTASNLQVNGTRITWTNSSGELYAKDWTSSGGFGNAWVDEYGAVTQSASSSSMLVILTGGKLYGKVNLGDAWTELVYSGATNVQVSGNRITYTDSSGNVWAKDSLGGTWVEEYGAVTQYAASSSLLVILSGGNLYAKAGLSDSWSPALNPSAVSSFIVSGNRIVWEDTNGEIFAKDWDSTHGFYNNWYDEFGTTEQAYAASG
jgi:surface antigen